MSDLFGIIIINVVDVCILSVYLHRGWVYSSVKIYAHETE